MGLIAEFNGKKKRKTIHLKSILKTEVTNGTGRLEMNPKPGGEGERQRWGPGPESGRAGKGRAMGAAGLGRGPVGGQRCDGPFHF